MSKGTFAAARPIPPEDIGAVVASKTVNHVVGATPVVITRPSPDDKVLYLAADQGDFRFRVGDYEGKLFQGDDTGGVEEDILVAAAHGLQTGDGPFKVAEGTTLPTGLDETTLYFVRVVDANTLTLHLSQGDAETDTDRVDIETDGSADNVLGGPDHGTVEGGWANAVQPAAAVTDGYGGNLLGEGVTVGLSSPEKVTVVGFNATDVLTWWFAAG